MAVSGRIGKWRRTWAREEVGCRLVSEGVEAQMSSLRGTRETRAGEVLTKGGKPEEQVSTRGLTRNYGQGRWAGRLLGGRRGIRTALVD